MIGDIFYDKLDSKEEFLKTKFVNLADLYHEFIETKIKIQVEEKNEQKISRDQDDFEERKKKFYKDHIILSSKILFKNNEQQNKVIISETVKKRIIKCKNSWT